MIESMQASPVARVIISISAMLFAGFAMTRITKRLRLPNVTGYILAGILMGPCCLNVIPQSIIDGTDFLSDVALAFIAFSAGEFFKIDVLKRNGAKVIVITVLEACLASVAVFALVYGVLHLELSFSIVLAALASATAPASTMMTIRQTGAHGDFVDTLLQVVALDDVVGLILYSVAISVAMASESGHMQLATVMKPILANICVLALGALFGVMLKLFFRKRSKDNRLIVSIATLFAFCGICAMADVSPLLGCMSMGMTYINLTEDENSFASWAIGARRFCCFFCAFRPEFQPRRADGYIGCKRKRAAAAGGAALFCGAHCR
ncbi:MAG: cation:proton antiporter [Christensenellales bacterium]